MHGILDLFPHQNYYPMRLHIFKMFNLLIERTHMNIPIMHYIEAMLKSKNFYKKFGDKKAKEFDFEINFRCVKENFENNKYWEDLTSELLCVLAKHISLNQNAPYFDTMLNVPVRLLKRLYKSKMPLDRKVNVKRLVELLDPHAEQRRGAHQV
jgi:hypothetical protein